MVEDTSRGSIAGRGSGAHLKQALAVAESYVESLLSREISGLGVTAGEGDLLTVVLIAGDDSPAPGDLSGWLNLTTAGTTGRLDSLEQKALIQRRPNPTDGRRLTIHLTPAGNALAEAVLDAKDRALSDIIESGLGNAACKRLIADLGALTKAIDKHLKSSDDT